MLVPGPPPVLPVPPSSWPTFCYLDPGCGWLLAASLVPAKHQHQVQRKKGMTPIAGENSSARRMNIPVYHNFESVLEFQTEKLDLIRL